jgi:hypothetical protein
MGSRRHLLRTVTGYRSACIYYTGNGNNRYQNNSKILQTEMAKKFEQHNSNPLLDQSA